MELLQLAPLLYQLIVGDQVGDLKPCMAAMELCVLEGCQNEFQCNSCVLDIADTIEMNCDLLISRERPL